MIRKLIVTTAFGTLAALGVSSASAQQGSPAQAAASAYASAMNAESAAVGNYAEALRQWTLAADQGDVKAMYFLACLYDQGKGTVRDGARAAALYQQAAEKAGTLRFGDPVTGNSVSGEAMLMLAMLHERGAPGVARDPAKAAEWFRRWAKTGDPRAAATLAQRNIAP